MTLTINTIHNVNFTASKPEQSKSSSSDTKNPISKNGERSKLIAGTFIAGLGFGVKMLAELLDGDFVVSDLFKAGEKVAKKNFKNSSQNKQCIAALGAATGIIGLFVAGLAVLYTLFKAPKIAYDGKINAFTKSKDMDVYIKGNAIEKDLYTQMNDKAKNSSAEEKAELTRQYAVMQNAKNRVPDFVKNL